MIVLAALVLVAGAALLAIAAPFARDRLLRSRRRETVIVTLKSGTAFRGVLYRSDPTTLVLRNGEHLAADGSHVKVDGEVLLSRGEVDYLQRP